MASQFPQQQQHQQTDRRRHWLISRGLLSAHPGPTRRLASLIPRPHPQQPDVDVHVDERAVPIIVRARPESRQAWRAVSMPTDSAPPVTTTRSFSRPASTRFVPFDTAPDRPASPPGWSRRFLRRRRKLRRVPAAHSQRPASVDGARTGRAVYTVVDRTIPRKVLEGDAKFSKAAWDDYRDKIDRLAEDDEFMQYLTAPVQPRASLNVSKEGTAGDAQQLAVNKLYPLAFIRLLEAHAKFASEACEEYDAADEEHRYDDPDRDDEDRVLRTTSSGLYDFARFRTVAGSTSSGDASSQSGATADSEELVRLLQAPPKRRPPFPRVPNRLGKSNQLFVPVC